MLVTPYGRIGFFPKFFLRYFVTSVSTPDEYKKAVSTGIVVAKFGAEWCGPCKKSKPMFEELSNKLESVKFIDLDIDKLPELAEENRVTTIPMFKIYRNGKVMAELVGSDIPKLEEELPGLWCWDSYKPLPCLIPPTTRKKFPVSAKKWASRCLSSCLECQSHLTSSDDLVSTSFRGRTGSAWLFSRVVNVLEGPFEDRMMTTGQHTIVDIYCKECGSNIGWKYQEATEESEKYKCGMYILEKALFTRTTSEHAAA